MLPPGSPFPLGSVFDGTGANVSVNSPARAGEAVLPQPDGVTAWHVSIDTAGADGAFN